MTEINNSNYQAYTNLDIVAFSFAYEGAMGEGGGIEIIDRGGQMYHANYYYGKDHLEREHIKDIIPAITDIDFYLVGCESKNENWKFVYLGFGNNLFVVNDIYNDFMKKVEEAHFETVGQLYQRWSRIVLSILNRAGHPLSHSNTR